MTNFTDHIDMGDAELARDLETGSYQIAFMLEATGEFEVVETFHAADDQAANEYAEQNYGDRPWYVLDSSARNINGGPHQGN